MMKKILKKILKTYLRGAYNLYAPMLNAGLNPFMWKKKRILQFLTQNIWWI